MFAGTDFEAVQLKPVHNQSQPTINSYYIHLPTEKAIDDLVRLYQLQNVHIACLLSPRLTLNNISSTNSLMLH